MAAAWDLRCLLCGTVAGRVIDGAFVHDPACTRALRFEAGRRRCCRCGGSLLREPGNVPWELPPPGTPRPSPDGKPRRR